MILQCFSKLVLDLSVPVVLLSGSGAVMAHNRAARQALERDLQDADLVELANEPKALRRYLSLASRSTNRVPGSARFNGSETRWRCTAGAIRSDQGPMILLELQESEASGQRFLALNAQVDRLNAEIRRRQKLEVERQALLARETEARAAAEQANNLKNELLASVSHELRTPLNAIAGWLALIRRDPSNRQYLERGLEVIERNLAIEQQLAEDLVDTSILISGRMTLVTQPVELAEVVWQAVESLQPTAAAKRQRIQVFVDAADCTVSGDSARLQQVVWNLLSNASKYSPDGSDISIALKRINSHVEIEVCDEGEGISQELLPYVFDRFRRADGGTTRRHGGLGLGLAIVRHLVELHGGVVMADSEGPGRGSTFTVSLPMTAFLRAEAVADDTPNADGGDRLLTGIRLLLVEDHDDSREILTRTLETYGTDVQAASSSAEAQELFRASAPDIILSDIEMPDEDGFTLMRKLREIEKDLGRTPVPAIALSAHGIGEAQLRALRAGFQTFLTKPAKPADLVAIIASLCRRHSNL